MRRLGSNVDNSRWQAKRDEAQELSGQGKYEQADHEYRAALRLAEAALGPLHEDVLELLELLEHLQYCDIGDWSRSIPIKDGTHGAPRGDTRRGPSGSGARHPWARAGTRPERLPELRRAEQTRTRPTRSSVVPYRNRRPGPRHTSVQRALRMPREPIEARRSVSIRLHVRNSFEKGEYAGSSPYILWTSRGTGT